MGEKMIIKGKNTDYQIRLASQRELPDLKGVEQAAAKQFAAFGLAKVVNTTLPIETLAGAQKRGHVWVIAATSGEIAGFALVSVVKERLHLEEIDIDPAHSRQGLGKALIGEICAWAGAAGFKTISLSTFKDIPWNAPYYERLGFSVVPGQELNGDFLAIREAEARAGLPVSRRVIMLKRL